MGTRAEAEGGLIWREGGGRGSGGVLGESQGGRTGRPDLAQPPEQQEQGENQFSEETSVGDLVVVESEN